MPKPELHFERADDDMVRVELRQEVFRSGPGEMWIQESGAEPVHVGTVHEMVGHSISVVYARGPVRVVRAGGQ